MNVRRTLAVVVVLTGACELGREAPRVVVPVVTAASTSTAMLTDLGYEVELTRMRVAIEEMRFTPGGEEHDFWRSPPSEEGDSSPVYHPGHAVGGEVLGELRGPILVDVANDGDRLGDATLVAADYDGADLVFRRAGGAEDALSEEDPILGFTVHVEGVAERDGEVRRFDALVDLEGAEVVGIPFDARITEEPGMTLAFELRPSVANVTLFDRFAFFALEPDDRGWLRIRPGGAPHDVLAENLGRHEHYAIRSLIARPAGAPLP
jgi:hypothetical protein